MEDWNRTTFFQFSLNIEAFRPLNIFKIYSSKSWRKRRNDINELIWILLINFQIKDINISKTLKENSLTLHHRLRSQCPAVSKSKDCRTIGNHCNKISLGGVAVCVLWIICDFQYGLRHSWGICKRKILCTFTGLGRNYRNLSRFSGAVIAESFFFKTVHFYPLKESLTLFFASLKNQRYMSNEKNRGEKLNKNTLPFKREY